MRRDAGDRSSVSADIAGRTTAPIPPVGNKTKAESFRRNRRQNLENRVDRLYAVRRHFGVHGGGVEQQSSRARMHGKGVQLLLKAQDRAI